MLPQDAFETPRVEEDPSYDPEYRWEDDAKFSVFLLTHHLPGNPSAWRTAPTLH